MKLFVLLSFFIFGCGSTESLDSHAYQPAPITNIDTVTINKPIYYYLVKRENAIPNNKGYVLLHISNTDSLYVDPINVKSLHLYPNQKDKQFPSEVFIFKNLEYLWVGMRGFETIPKEIAKLKKLRSLDLQHGFIKYLPAEITQLKKLKKLTLLFSKIEYLPENIGALTSLKILHLGRTQIKKLPQSLDSLRNLKTLILSPSIKVFDIEMEQRIEELKQNLPNTNIHFANKLID